MESKNLSFKVSAGLKSLIGKELITDEYVAIFELVKNSFDARATDIKIIFENIYSENSKIIIIDNGKGMNFEELKNKWLFVAYSAKKDGTEDQNETVDYRDKIATKRLFAGAKGVGRFSCDRLGSKLNLLTIKKKPSSVIESISINWDDFEKNSKDEFVDIGVKHEVLDNVNYNISHGTVLEIFDLRDEWNRDKLLRLKQSLEKLINPNKDNDNITIEMIVEEEAENDTNAKRTTEKINGIIINTIFEKLNLKTTQIITEISNEGTQIITTLLDRGKLIYKISEKNNYSIADININLFYLNQLAKTNFTKLMGVRPVRYGSVFLYKNGFRIYPFGEEGEDILKLDRRKIQGQRRYLGTRELIGRIEIVGVNDEFVETTSRDGGLIKNSSYENLMSLFLEKSLRRLERYVVDIIKWGEPYKINKIDTELQEALSPEDVREKILKTINSLTRSKDIISVEYDRDFFEIIEERQEKSITNIFNDISIKTLKNVDDIKFQSEIKKIGVHLKDLLIEKKEIEDEVDQKTDLLKEVNIALEQTKGQNLFLKSIATVESQEIISLQHHINHSTNAISRNLDFITEALDRGADKTEMLEYLRKISLENSKIATIAKFVTKANFNLKTQQITADLVAFVNEYIENVYMEYKHLKINNQRLDVRIDKSLNIKFDFKFRPLEIIIVLDNLLNNSYKAKANVVNICWEKIDEDKVEIHYKDDGIGIPTANLEHIFDFGFTTTDGSGIGLHHVNSIIKNMNGFIRVNNNVDKGVEFILGVKK